MKRPSEGPTARKPQADHPHGRMKRIGHACGKIGADQGFTPGTIT